MAKKHSIEAFYALDDPLETAIFSLLIELLKERGNSSVLVNSIIADEK